MRDLFYYTNKEQGKFEIVFTAELGEKDLIDVKLIN